MTLTPHTQKKNTFHCRTEKNSLYTGDEQRTLMGLPEPGTMIRGQQDYGEDTFCFVQYRKTPTSNHTPRLNVLCLMFFCGKLFPFFLCAWFFNDVHFVFIFFADGSKEVNFAFDLCSWLILICTFICFNQPDFSTLSQNFFFVVNLPES